MAGFNPDCEIVDIRAGGQKITNVSTAVVTSDPIDVGHYNEAMAFINVSAQSGTTPTLDCKIQYSSDYVPATQGSQGNAGTWLDSGDAFTQITTVTGAFIKKLTANFGKYIRLVYTPGGTTPIYTVTSKLVAKQA